MTREEAAAKAIKVMDDATFDYPESSPTLTELGATDLAQAALAAADAHDAAHGIHRVSLDDATVERIADIVFPKATTTILVGFKQTHDDAWVLARDEHHATIRAVLAAAVEAGQ